MVEKHQAINELLSQKDKKGLQNELDIIQRIVNDTIDNELFGSIYSEYEKKQSLIKNVNSNLNIDKEIIQYILVEAKKIGISLDEFASRNN